MGLGEQGHQQKRESERGSVSQPSDRELGREGGLQHSPMFLFFVSDHAEMQKRLGHAEDDQRDAGGGRCGLPDAPRQEGAARVAESYFKCTVMV